MSTGNQSMSATRKNRSKMIGMFAYAAGALMLTGAGAAGSIYAMKAGYLEAGAPSATPAEISYFAFQQPFTSNLRDTGSFAQLSLSVATRDNVRAAEAVKLNEAALRSVVLMTVADQDATVLATTAGKQLLQQKLRTVMDDFLKAKDGQSGIDSVYFTSFVIQ
jgi:flagellar basal body-associated protein FliL